MNKKCIGLFAVGFDVASGQIPLESFLPPGDDAHTYGRNIRHRQPATTYSKPKKEVEKQTETISKDTPPPLHGRSHPDKEFQLAGGTVGVLPKDAPAYQLNYDGVISAPFSAERKPDPAGRKHIADVATVRSLQCLKDKNRNPFYVCPPEQLVGGPPVHEEVGINLARVIPVSQQAVTGEVIVHSKSRNLLKKLSK